MSTTQGEGYPEALAGPDQGRLARSSIDVSDVPVVNYISFRNKLRNRLVNSKLILKGKMLRRMRLVNDFINFHRQPTRDVGYTHPQGSNPGAVKILRNFVADKSNELYFSGRCSMIKYFDSRIRSEFCQLFVLFYLFYMFVVYGVLFHSSMDPSSGTEKDTRRELYNRKKSKKSSDRKPVQVKLRPVVLTSRKLPVIPSLSLEQLEEIYKGAPEVCELDPSAGFEFSNIGRVAAWIASFDPTKRNATQVMALFESITLLLANLYQANTRKHQLSILLMWVQCRFAADKSLLLNMTEVVCWLAGYETDDVSKMATNLAALWSNSTVFSGKPLFNKSDVYEPKAGPEQLDDLTKVSYAKYLESESVVRIKTLLQLFVDAGLCTVFGYKFDFGKSSHALDFIGEFTGKLHLVDYTFNTIKYFMERGYAAYCKKSLKHLFFSNDFIDADLEMIFLQDEARLLFAGREGSIPLDEAERRCDLLKVAFKKQLLIAGVMHRPLLIRKIAELGQLSLDFDAMKKKIGMRASPFSILLYGISGVGKSWVSGTLAPMLLKAMGLPYDPFFIRSPNEDDDYDSMIDSSTKCILLDDLANGEPKFMKKNPSTCVLRYMNNAAAVATKADLREKGRVFMQPRLVIGSTNVKDLNADMYSMDPVSIMRRFNAIVTVNCEAKYMTAGVLDKDLWPEWNRTVGLPPITFNVEMVDVIEPIQPAHSGPSVKSNPKIAALKYGFTTVKWLDPLLGREISMHNVDWGTFERYIKEKAIAHVAKQTQVMDTLKVSSRPTECQVHGITYPFCKVCFPCKSDVVSRRLCLMSTRLRLGYKFEKVFLNGITTPNTRTKRNRYVTSVKLYKPWYKSYLKSFSTVMAGASEVIWDPIIRRYLWRDKARRRPLKPLVPSSAPFIVDYLGQTPEEDPALVAVHDLAVNFTDTIITFGILGVTGQRLAIDTDGDSDFGSLPSIDDSFFGSDDEVEIDHLDSPVITYGIVDPSFFDDDNDLERLDEPPDFHPSDGEEILGGEKKYYDALHDLVLWYNHFTDIEYLSRIDVPLLDRAVKARITLGAVKGGSTLPLDVSQVPPLMPVWSQGFADPNDRYDRDEMREIITVNLAFQHRVRMAVRTSTTYHQQAEATCNSGPRAEDLSDEGRYRRIGLLLSMQSSKVFGAAVWSGALSARCFGSFKALILSILFHIGVIIYGSLGIVAIANPIVQGICFIIFLPLMAAFCAASCVGIRLGYLVKALSNLKMTSAALAGLARKTLKFKYHLVVGTVAVLACGWMISSKNLEEDLEPSGSTVSVPKPAENERTNNYWVAHKVDIVSLCQLPAYQNTPEELQRAINRQLVRIRVYPKEVRRISDGNGSKVDSCCAITMAGGLLLLPNHIIAGKMGCLIHVMRDGPSCVRNNSDWILRESDCYCVPGTDFAIIHTTCLGAAADLRRYFPAVILKEPVRTKWLLKDKCNEGSFPILTGTALPAFDEHTIVTGVGSYAGYNFQLHDDKGGQLESQKGWCMSYFVTATNPSCIHSFYLAGRGKHHRSAPFLRHYVDQALEHFKDLNKPYIPSAGEFLPCKDGLLSEAGKRSPISHLDKCEESDIRFDFLGTNPADPHRRFSGKVRNTPFAPSMQDLFDCPYEWTSPADLGSWKPYWTNLQSMGVQMNPFDPEILDIAYKDLKDQLEKNCMEWTGPSGEKFQDVVHPVPAEVAINGAPGVPGIDRVKLATSAGFPLNTSKRKVFDSVFDDSYPCGERLVPNDLVQQHTDYILDCAKRDERSNIVFRATPKDEPTVTSKTKVRIFAGCPVAYLIAMRMNLATLVKFMTDNHLLFYTVAGANAHDYDWTLIGEYLAEYSIDRLIAGDYSDYDKKILASLMVMAVQLTAYLLTLAGYTEEQVRITINLMLESCYPIYEWNGDFIQVNGSNPSGQPLTVWLNNLVNLLYQRYVFYSFYGSNFIFSQCVRILVMGDDNVMSVKEGFEKYNHTSIQSVLGSLGLKYTMADKESESRPYIGLDEASLLKRKFVWSEEFEAYLCPLEEKSIFRCLYAHMLSCGENSEELRTHCMMMCDTALVEWFYHGKLVYLDRLEKVKQLLVLTGMIEHVPRLLSWNDQCVRFVHRLNDSRCRAGMQPKLCWSKFSESTAEDALEMEPMAGGERTIFLGCKDVTPFDLSDFRSSFAYILVDGARFPELILFEDVLDKHKHVQHLGVHASEYFDDDSRVLEAKGKWVLVAHDELLDAIYLNSLPSGTFSHSSGAWRASTPFR